MMMQTSKKESRDYLFNTINDALYHVIHSCRIYILQTTEQTEKAEQVILSCLICISSNVRIYRRIYFVYQSIYLLPLLISESKSIHCNEFNIIHSLLWFSSKFFSLFHWFNYSFRLTEKCHYFFSKPFSKKWFFVAVFFPHSSYSQKTYFISMTFKHVSNYFGHDNCDMRHVTL